MAQEHDTMRGVAGRGELPTRPSRWRRIVWGEGVPRFNAVDDEGTPLFIPDDRWIAPWSAGSTRSAHRAYAAISHGSSWAFIGALPGLLLIVLVFVNLTISYSLNMPFGWRIAAVVAFTVLTLPIISHLSLWWMARWSRRDAQAMSAAGLAQGCCPRCLHDLTLMREVAIEQGLHTVPCERCNAAWNTDRVRHPADIMRQPPTQDDPSQQQSRIRKHFTTGPARTGTVRDAQDVPVPLWQPNLSARDVNTIPPADTLVLQQQYAAHPSLESLNAHDRRVVLYYAIAFVIVGTIAVIASQIEALSFLVLPLGLGYIIAVVVGGTLLIEVHNQRANRTADRRRAENILKHNFCPSCGAELGSVSFDASGTRTCPQCAAVWGSGITQQPQ